MTKKLYFFKERYLCRGLHREISWDDSPKKKRGGSTLAVAPFSFIVVAGRSASRLSSASPVPGASTAAAVVPAFIEGRVEGVEVPAVQMILHDSESFAESLEMHDLSGAEKFDGIVDVRVVFDKAENVVVSDPGFLFCSEVFHQVCDRVAGGLESSRGERHAAGGLRPEAGGVVHIVVGEALFLNLFHGEIPGELMHDGADHLDVV